MQISSPLTNYISLIQYLFTLNTAIITGSTKGIGKATAILFAKAGMNVVVSSRSQNDVEKTVQEIKSLAFDKDFGRKKIEEGRNNLSVKSQQKPLLPTSTSTSYESRRSSSYRGEVIGSRCDVSISSDIHNLVYSTIGKFGKIDILINNAGILQYKNLIDISEEEWNKIININLTGTFLFCKAVLPTMIKRRSGTIINVSSGAGKSGFPKLSAYCASKFGIIGLGESLAGEVSNFKNIRVMTICPGEIDTDMIGDAINLGFKPHCKRNEMYKPEDVGQKILEMVVKDRKYSSGQCVEFYSGIAR